MGSLASPEKCSFISRGMKLAALLWHPASGSPDRKGAAIIIAHPWTSIKEQSPANYAKVLSAAGFICLTYDAAFQGESEGEPRSLEDPYQRVEDMKCAVTYLTSLKGVVDPNKIGLLGICAAGGYAPFATQTDLRIKACATSAAVCVGAMARRGFDKDSSNMSILQGQLEAAAKDRNSDVTGEKVPIVHLLPPKVEDAKELPESFQDLAQYYRVRQPHERAPNTCLPRSWDIMATFDAFAHNDMISPRPLLMITGTKAATKWYSEDGVAKAKEPKELMVIDGMTHADLYDHVDVAGPKLVDFFGKALA